MKLALRILLGMVIALIATACASPNAAQTSGASSGAAESADRPYTPSDASLVANTGRAQFLDSYADW